MESGSARRDLARPSKHQTDLSDRLVHVRRTDMLEEQGIELNERNRKSTDAAQTTRASSFAKKHEWQNCLVEVTSSPSPLEGEGQLLQRSAEKQGEGAGRVSIRTPTPTAPPHPDFSPRLEIGPSPSRGEGDIRHHACSIANCSLTGPDGGIELVSCRHDRSAARSGRGRDCGHEIRVAGRSTDRTGGSRAECHRPGRDAVWPGWPTVGRRDV